MNIYNQHYVFAPAWNGPVHRFVAFYGHGIDEWHSENVHAASPVITVGPDYDYRVYGGSVDGQVYHLDFHTGEIMSTFSVWPGETNIVRGVVYRNGVIYCSAGNNIYAYNITDGPLWLGETGGMTTIPVVDDGKVYVGSWDKAVHAFDLDGKPIWTSKAASFFAAELRVNEGTVYATSQNNKLYALNGNDGSVIWQADTGQDLGFISPVAISNGIIYATSAGSVYALSAADGTLVWKTKVGHHLTPPTISSDRVLVSQGNSIGANYVYALNAADGELVWQSQKPVGPDGNYNCQPAVGGWGFIAVTSQDGYIYNFAGSDGWFAWKSLINEGSSSWPIRATFARDPPDYLYYESSPDNFIKPGGCMKLAPTLRSPVRLYERQRFRLRRWLSR